MTAENSHIDGIDADELWPIGVREPAVLVHVLGPCRISRVLADPGSEGREWLDLTDLQQRLLARLALGARRPVSLAALTHTAWDGNAPERAVASIHNQISRLRKLLGAEAIVTSVEGYTLHAAVDSRLMTDLAERCESEFTAANYEAAADLARVFLAWWERPYASLFEEDAASPAAPIPAVARLAEWHYSVTNTQLACSVALGRYQWAASAGRELLDENPRDERRCLLLASALNELGRRGDALAVIAATRQHLAHGFGIDVGRDLQDLERQIVGPPALEVTRTATGGLVGRDSDIARIVEAMRTAQVIEVTGEPGIGITRVLREVAHVLRQAGTRAVLVDARRIAARPLGVLVEIYDQLGAEHGAGQVIEGFIAAVTAASAQQPLALLIDDAEFIGPTTRRILSRAAHHGGAIRVILGHHGGVDASEMGRQIRLSPLPDEATRRLVSQSADLPSDSAAQVARAAGGNPLLAELLAVAAAGRVAAGQLVHDGPAASPPEVGDPRATEMPVSATLTDTIRRWRAHYSAAQNAALDWIAVAGAAAYPALLSEVTGTEFAPVGELVETNTEGALQFRHAVVRDVVYADVALGRRAEMHHALSVFLGESAGIGGLDESSLASLNAQHRVQAGVLDPAGAVTGAIDLALQHASLGAHRDAIHWLRTASAAANLANSPDATKVEIDIALGDAMRLAGDPAHFDYLISVVRRTSSEGDSNLLASAALPLLQLGGSSEFGGLDQRIIDLVRVIEADVTDPDLLAPMLAAASLAWSMTGQCEQATAFFARAERIAADDATRMAVLPYAYLALGMPDDLPRRAELTAELLELATRHGDPSAAFEAHHLGISVAVAHARGEDIRVHFAALQELIQTTGDIGHRWELLYLGAAVAHLDGDIAECERLAQLACDLFVHVSPVRARAAMFGQVLIVKLLAGQAGDLTPMLRELVRSSPQIGAWHGALAVALAASGAPEQEIDELVRIALSDVQPDFLWLAAQLRAGRAAAEAGSDEVVRACYDRLLPHAMIVCWQGTCSYGPVATVLAQLAARLGDTDAARAHCATAVDLSRRMDGQPFLVEARALGDRLEGL